jgi:hypothetical protein
MMDTPPILNNYVSRTKATGLKPVVFYAVLSLFYYIGVMEVSEKFVKESFSEELKIYQDKFNLTHGLKAYII